MSKNTLENLFKNLENNFDIEIPEAGHEIRFLNKLNEKKVIKITTSKRNIWKPLIVVAASIVLILVLVISIPTQKTSGDLATVSPKMAKTQDFFTLTINEELNKLNSEASPEVQNLINDALLQIKKLENDYNTLKIDLLESGDDNRVIYAMISNFQNRIDILQNTLNQIKNVKQLKNSSLKTSKSII